MAAGYHRSHERPVISDDELIDNPDHHFMFRGFKFANPEIVLEQKISIEETRTCEISRSPDAFFQV